MKRADDLTRLIELRRIRLDRAERTLAEKTSACETARHRVDAATAEAVAHGERRTAREDALFGRLSSRPLSVTEIGRARDTLDRLQADADALDGAEQEAIRRLDEEKRGRAEAAQERLRLERERDKLATLSRTMSRHAAQRAELAAELDDDGRARRPALSRRPA